MQAGKSGRRRAKLVTKGSLLMYRVKNICTNALSKRTGRWTIIPKTEDIPPRGKKVDLKTVSQGNATRVAQAVLCPEGQIPQGKRESSSLFYHFPPAGCKDPKPRLLQHWTIGGIEGGETEGKEHEWCQAHQTSVSLPRQAVVDRLRFDVGQNYRVGGWLSIKKQLGKSELNCCPLRAA